MKKIDSDRLTVWVLMGGPSSEHEVSKVSGSGMVRALDPKRFAVVPVVISKTFEWKWTESPLSADEQGAFDATKPDSLKWKSAVRPSLMDLPKCDVALLGLHGRFGEDGTVQALLDYYEIPYTGSGRLASSLGMNKIKSKEIYRQNGIPTSDWVTISAADLADEVALRQKLDVLPWPLFLKDPEGGSSIDMGKADDFAQALKLAKRLLEKFPVVLAEGYVKGRECSIGALEGSPKPLPPTEIIPKGEYFDYEAKYNGYGREVTPAEFAPEVTAELQFLTLKAHRALGCSVYSRTDFIVDALGKPWALETNTLPGMTPTSLLPQQAASVGMGYSALVEHVLKTSLARFGLEWDGWSC